MISELFKLLIPISVLYSFYLIYKYTRKRKSFNFLKSVLNGETSEIKEYLSNHHDPKSILLKEDTENGYTALHIACHNGNLPLVKLFLQIGGQELLEKRSSESGMFPIHLAIIKGDYHIVEFILESLKPAQYLDNSLNSPIYTSAFTGNLEILKQVVEYYKKHQMSDMINFPNLKKQTPLYISCLLSHYQIVEYLIKEKSDVSIKDIRGNTALHASCMNNGNEKIIELLIKNKADINSKKTDLCTPLHVACFKGFKGSVKVLLDHGADIYSTDIFGSNPLQHAICHQHVNILELFDNEKLIQMRDKDGFNCLFSACNYLKNHEKEIEWLCNRSKVNEVDTFNSTALHIAVCSNNFIAVKVLIEKFKANTSIRNLNGLTPYLMAQKEIKDYLENKCNSQDKIAEKPKEKIIEKVQVLKELSIQHIVDLIKKKEFKNVLVLTGAGISTGAGIPDFRSDKGIYSKIKDMNLDITPEEVFNIQTFKSKPELFWMTRKSFFTMKDVKPTKCHEFIKFLSDQGILLRNYTQNIDSLEEKIGVPEDKVVQCHGNLKFSKCLNPNCNSVYSTKDLEEILEKVEIPKCLKCQELIKPNIVFFGEGLPKEFNLNLDSDLKKCDLLIVIGTSLMVYPFSTLPSKISGNIPRILLNDKIVGDFKIENNKFENRDLILQGDCQENITKFLKLLESQ